MQRTIRVRLWPTPAQASALAETARLFTLAFDAVVAYGWLRGERNGVTLHHATYRPLKAAYPSLVSDLHITGVDLGLAQPAVTSNNRFLGQRRWRDVEARRFKLRRALQKAGTKSAKRHLKRMRRKQARFRRDCDHVLSKRIVQGTPPGGTVVLENLTNIRIRVRTRTSQQARRIHGWSFDQLRAFIEYKAEERGCTVVGVDPRHTSQACSRCGHVARNNRRSRGWFRCRRCGFQLHADLNGARNIAAKYRAGLSNAEAGGQTVMLPLAGDTGALHQSSTCKLPVSVGSS